MAGGIEAGEHAWEQLTVGWHAMIALALAVATGLVLAHDEGGQRAAALALLAACGAWYAVRGVRAIGGARATGLGYVVVAVPLVVALFAVDPVAGGILLFPLYPHIWLMLPVRRAVVATVVLTVAIAVVQIVEAGTENPAGLPSLLGWMGGMLAAALGLGFYIDRIVAQSRHRADLLAELARTRADLAAVSHEAGALAERERLSREIHDTLAQGFTSILLLARAAAGAPDPGPQLARIEETARVNLAESRALVAALAPPGLATDGLPAALRRLAERTGFGPLEVTGPERALPTGQDVVLLRVAQEALANVGKHAPTATATVTLAYSPETVRLTVRDDGCGFSPDAGDGFGLAGMRDRVRCVGGVLTVASTPGAGTCVEVVL